MKFCCILAFTLLVLSSVTHVFTFQRCQMTQKVGCNNTIVKVINAAQKTCKHSNFIKIGDKHHFFFKTTNENKNAFIRVQQQYSGIWEYLHRQITLKTCNCENFAYTIEPNGTYTFFQNNEKMKISIDLQPYIPKSHPRVLLNGGIEILESCHDLSPECLKTLLKCDEQKNAEGNIYK